MNNEQNTGSAVEYAPPSPPPIVVDQAQPITSVPPEGAKPSKILAILSLVAGILAFLGGLLFTGIVFGVVAVVLGAMALKKRSGGKGLAITGIITGAIGLISGLIFTVLAVLTLQGSLFSVAPIEKADWEIAAEAQAADDAKYISAQKEFAKGETAQFGPFEFKVNSVNDGFLPEQPVRSDYTDDEVFAYVSLLNRRSPTEGTRFVILDITVKNTNKKVETLSTIEMVAGGQVISAYPSSLIDLQGAEKPEFEELGEIEPGQSSEGKLVFEVKNGVTGMKLQYKMSATNPATENNTELKYSLTL